jgi:hypothetical protein
VLSARVAAATVGVVTIVGAAVYGTTMPPGDSGRRAGPISSGASRSPCSGSRSATGCLAGASDRERRVPPSGDRRSALGATDGNPRATPTSRREPSPRGRIEILDSVATGDNPVPLHHVAALTAWAAVFGVLARLGYRRDEGERFT